MNPIELLETSGFELSKETLAAARNTIDRNQQVSFEKGSKGSLTRKAFVRLRRVRDETENLLVDLQKIGSLKNSSIAPRFFLVPHSNLFDGYLKDTDLKNFFFGILDPFFDDESQMSALRARELRFQISEIFQFRQMKDDRSVIHRNILLDVSVEEIQNLLRATTHKVDVLATSLETLVQKSTIHLSSIVDDVKRIAGGLWQSNILDAYKLRQKIREIANVLDGEIAKQLDKLLDDAWLQGQLNQRLLDIFRHGKFYRINACPDLPSEVRQLYVQLAQGGRLNKSYKILLSQIGEMSEYQETQIIKRADTSGKSVAQHGRDARLLALIHIANRIMEDSAARSDVGSLQQVQLVTNADRIAELVNAFSSYELRVPVRHPRLLAATLQTDLLLTEGIEKSLSVMAATLDDVVKNAELSGGISLAKIEETRKDLKESWRLIVENMIMYSRSYVADAIPVSAKFEKKQLDKRIAGLDKRMREANQREQTPQSLDPLAIGASVLHAASIEVAGRLVELRDTEHQLCLDVSRDDTGIKLEVAAIPVTRHLRFVVRLSNKAIIDRLCLKKMPRILSFVAFKKAIDPPLSSNRNPTSTLPEVMANRLTLALEAMALANWKLADAICSYAFDRYQSMNANDQELVNPVINEILLVRQMALRALAAQSWFNVITSANYLKAAQEDIERLKVLRPDDVQIMLIEAAFYSELLEWKSSAAFGSAISDTIPGRSLNEICNAILRLNRRPPRAQKEKPGMLFSKYFSLRIHQTLMMLYLIVWSGAINPVVSKREIEDFKAQLDWQKYFDDFRNAFEDFIQSATKIIGSRQEIKFPLASFLIVFGETVIANNSDLKKDGKASPDIATAITTAIRNIENMHEFGEGLSEKGFTKRIVRAALHRIVLEQRDFSVNSVREKFEEKLPTIY